MPVRFTADGHNLSPPLRWTRPPGKTLSLAVLCHDPDAPGGDFVHWTLWEIPAGVQELEEGQVVPGSISGLNDFGKIGYLGPSPPSGKVHHYVFEVMALDCHLNLLPGAGKVDFQKAIAGHVLSRGQLGVVYRR